MAYLEDDTEGLKSLLPELEANYGETHTWGGTSETVGIASYYFYLGENDKGFEWLERGFSRREALLPWVTVNPMFDSVRTDPRYLDLVKRLGLD